MGAISVFRFRISSDLGEMKSERWATEAAIAALDVDRADDVEWTVDAKWIDERGVTVEGVRERPSGFQREVRERMRTPEEAAQRWLDGPGE